MKKYLLPLIGLLFTANAQATSFTDGKEYIILEKPIAFAPPALKFFLFYCSSCYRYDEVPEITDNVRRVLPTDTKLAEYYADFLGPLGQGMTHVWSVVMLLNTQDKVKPLLSDVVQKKRIAKTVDDIRNVFISTGISISDYDVAWNSFAVKSLTAKQQEMTKAVDLTGVPVTFINGKYMTSPRGLNFNGPNAFAQNCADTACFLINKS